MTRTLVTGATGFVGRRLLQQFENPVVLSRDATRAKQRITDQEITPFPWNASEEIAPLEAFQGVDTVFHLAGEPVAEGRWSAAKKQRLRESRQLGTRHLVDALAKLEDRPKVLVSASAVGYYGTCKDEVLTESSPPADDFLAGVCVEWEEEARRAAEHGIRVVSLRIGVVLGPHGGALAKMLTPFRLGVAGVLGNGQQWMPWIHLDDLVRLFVFCAGTPQVSGPVNATAPNPVTNREFTKAMGNVLRRPTVLPMPAFALRLLFGEFGNILLASQRVVPNVAETAGFEFRFGEIEPALRNILGKD